MAQITNDWLKVLEPEFKKPYYRELFKFVRNEYATKVIYPPAEDLFNALHLTSYSGTRVVILGQDPYHNQHQAHGLAFSVPEDQPTIPPSLINIFRELHDDVGCRMPDNGCLVKWAKQGVLLLNTVLTVRAHQPASHQGKGWEQFTDAILRALDRKEEPVVFMLWGAPAQAKAGLITQPGHLVLKAPHPSPLSAYRGFFGCAHFSRCNEYLRQNGMDPIDWQIDNIHDTGSKTAPTEDMHA